MSDDSESVRRFAGMLSSASTKSYPINIAHTHKSGFALKNYNDRLVGNENVNFTATAKQWSILLWDLKDDSDEFQLHPRISSLPPLMSLMDATAKDPRCRFIFIPTAGSRGPLCCSLDQLTHVLTYHQVMPAFLDFCFEFRKREGAGMTNWLRIDDCLQQRTDPRQHVPRSLGRSGLKIQHCFNLMAFESDPDYAWPLRHTTVYHSFDLEEGRAVWIVIKGNKLIRDRITFSQRSDLQAPHSVHDRFGSSLRTHLQIFEWCIENWTQHIAYFEGRARKHSTIARHAPVEGLAAAAENYKPAIHVGSQPPAPSRAGTGISRAFSGLSRLTHRATTFHHQGSDVSGPTLKEKAIPEEIEAPKKDAKFDDLINFEAQQDIHQLTGDLEDAIHVIDENLKIFSGLRRRYESFVSSPPGATFADEIPSFVQQVDILESDLTTHRNRLAGLGARLQKHDEMFKRALEYRNMVTGVSYARSAQDSARTMEHLSEKMHRIAERTEHKTVSMHVITILGLLFLPGTFVSTLLSTGIFDFENRPDGVNIGDWNVRWAALKIFLLLCLVLMALTVPIWWVAYKVRRREQSELNSEESD